MRINLKILVSFGLLLQISANGFSQITIKRANLSIRELIEKIEKQSPYVFLINDEVDMAKKITVNLHNSNINDALGISLKGTGITFSIVERNVLLKNEQQSMVDRIKSVLTSRSDFNFKVLDEDGQALVGANLKASNTRAIYKSDYKGMFFIKDVEDETVLEISFIGYETTTFLTGNINGSVILKKSSISLQDITVDKGYYTTSQKLNTGSTVQVTAQQLEQQPQSNPISSLEGLVPGMYIRQSSGVAGAPNTVQIRGQSSINSGTSPLYILDGVPFLGSSVDRQIGAGVPIIGSQTNGSSDPMNVINPSDIESITILKDADATAIYGSRGSNGVVLITTKKAKVGRPSLSINVQRGYGQVVNQLELLPLDDYLALRRQAFANDNKSPTAAIAPDLLLWDQHSSTDIQDFLIGNTSKITDLSASLSTGTARSSILLSGSYHNELSVLFGGKGYKRGTVNVNASTGSDDERLKLNIGANLSFVKNNMPGTDFTSSLYTIPQNFSLYDGNGGINWIRNFDNPVAASRQTFRNDNKNININASLVYKLFDGLTFKTSAGYNRIEQKQSFQAGASTINPLIITPISAAIYSTANTEAVVVEPQFDYNKKINAHSFSLSTGGTWQSTYFEVPYVIVAQDFASESLLGSFTNAGTISAVRALDAQYRYVSFFGRANYNLRESYVVNVTFRRDGSSRFGPDRKFGSFGSVGAAWIFSDVQYLKNQNFLSFGKLRGSLGITGNDQIDNYGYSDTYTSTSSTYGGNPGFYPTRIANPTYSWESSKKIEIAMELGFLNNRIKFIPSLYRSRSDNMIIRDTPLPAQSGFNSYTSNLNAMVQNQGFELEIFAKAVKSKKLQWDLGFNITKNRNKLLSLPPSLISLYENSYQVGQPLTMNAGYHFTGFINGIAQIEDRNGDGIITSGLTGDYYIMGNSDPAYYGGFTSALTYKYFRLDILLNFAAQKGFDPVAYPGAFGAQLSILKDSQFIPSTTTTTPSYASYNRYLFSDASLTDASYIRLRNLSLSYTLPEKVVRAVKITQAQIFLRGQNVFTLTKYKGLDPETKSGALPPLRVFSAGLSCTF